MTWLLKGLLLLPVKILGGSAKAAGATTAGSFRLGYRTGRLVGYKRIVLFGIGAGAALMLTPLTGPQLRERVSRLVGGRTGAGQASTVPPPAHAPSSTSGGNGSATPPASTPPSATPPPATPSSAAAPVPAEDDVVDVSRPADGAALEDPATAPDGPIE